MRKIGTGSEDLHVAHPALEALQNHADVAPTIESAAPVGTLTPPLSTRLLKRKKTVVAASAVGSGRSGMASPAVQGECVSLRVLI